MSSTTVRDGVVVGLIGFLSVAALYAAFDFVASRGTLYTVDLLGKSVFAGLRDPSVLGVPIERDMTGIVWYSALHLLLSLVIGIIVVSLVERAEAHPERAKASLVVIVAGFAVTIVAVGMLTSDMRQVLPWWSIVVANSLAVLLAGTYLMWKRPGTWSRLTA